jgi:altronate dehydratase large subunit
VAGGTQIIVFTTGRGTVTGHPITPVIKITGNKTTYENMMDNIDIDASPIIYEHGSLPALGDKLMQEVFDVAQGKLTKAEALGFIETSVSRVCNFV